MAEARLIIESPSSSRKRKVSQPAPTSAGSRGPTRPRKQNVANGRTAAGSGLLADPPRSPALDVRPIRLERRKPVQAQARQVREPARTLQHQVTDGVPARRRQAEA